MKNKIVALESLIMQAFGRLKETSEMNEADDGVHGVKEMAGLAGFGAKYELPMGLEGLVAKAEAEVEGRNGEGLVVGGEVKVNVGSSGVGGGDSLDHDFVAELLKGGDGYAKEPEPAGGELLAQEGLREEEVAASLSLEFLGK